MARPRRESFDLLVRVIAAAGGVVLQQPAPVLPYNPAVLEAMSRGNVAMG
jgi:hypothetical protein